MVKSSVFSILMTIIFLLSSSCATIVSRSSYPLTIQSNPSGAEVSITNRKGETVFSGITPTTVFLKAGGGFFIAGKYLVSVKKDGYGEQSIPVEMTFDAWYIGNLVFGGLIGFLIVDPATGAMFRLDRQFMNVNLGGSSASTLEGQEFRLYTMDEIPKEWVDHLEQIETPYKCELSY